MKKNRNWFIATGAGAGMIFGSVLWTAGVGLVLGSAIGLAIFAGQRKEN